MPKRRASHLTRIVLVCFLGASIIGTGVARAAIESSLVQGGLAAFNALDYPRAIELLTKARRQSLTREESVSVSHALALSHIAVGEEAAARRDFEALLRLAPSFTLGRNVAPHVRALFEQAKTAIATGSSKPDPSQRALRPELTPSRPEEGRALRVRLGDLPPGAVSGSLLHRASATESFSAIQAPAVRGAFEVSVPAQAVRAPGLEYYVSVLDEQGAPIGAAGSLAQPLRVEVTRKASRAWVWGLVGGLLVGAGLGVGLGVGLTRPATLTVQPH